VSESTRRPADRIIRRRRRETKIIDLPQPLPRSRPPTSFFHARIFVAAFALICLLGTALLALPWATNSGNRTALDDAFFVAVSAGSVTGLVTVDTETHWNWFGQLIILVLVQLGGLGFMVGASLVLSILGRGERLRDALLIRDNLPTLTVRDAVSITRRIVRFTVVVELLGAVLLTLVFARDMPIGAALWHGVFHSVSAFCNAGFDLQGDFESMGPYRTSIGLNLIFITLIQAGAISYIVFADVANRRRWPALSLNSKIVLTFNAALIVLALVLFLGAEWNGALDDSPTWSKPLQGLFQSVSGRTAGFSTVNFAEVSAFTLFVFLAMMFIGGASGSTAGGIKLATLAIVVTLVFSTVRGRSEPQIFNRRLPVSLIFRAFTVIMLFFLAHFVVTLLLVSTEYLYGANPAFNRLLFEAMSAIVTNGLGNGITPELSTPGKLLISIAMFLGRIGPLTLVYALQRQQRAARYRFPEETVHIG
jgi:trk system potassium uptake protein TrkH